MERYKRIYINMTVFMFVCFLAIVPIMHVIVPDRSFSESENRVLEKFPKFSLDRVLEGKFASDFDAYICDQFPGRDMWIGVKSDAERAMGKKENNGVFLGSDGYLLQKFEEPDRQDLKEKIEAINSFAVSMPETDKYFMLIPNSAEILKDKLPKRAPVADQRKYIREIEDVLDDSIKFVDVYDRLYSKRDEYIYYRTDHHWTSKGAYYGYGCLMAEMGLTPTTESDFDIKRVTDDFFGTLYSKSGFRRMNGDSIDIYTRKNLKKYSVEYYGEDELRNSIYDVKALNKKDKYKVFLGGNYPSIRITTNSKTGKKLLIMKDSYANSLVPFLLEHYDDIYIIDLRYFNGYMSDDIRTKDIDDILILYNVITFFEDKYITNIVR